jgi:hypothetical protein
MQDTYNKVLFQRNVHNQLNRVLMVTRNKFKVEFQLT